MTDDVVVLGAGYAGTAAVTRFQEVDPDGLSLHWIDDTATHLVRHEVHRAIRNPSVRDDLTYSLEEVADPSTTVTGGTVESVAVDDRTVTLEGGDTVSYDYLIVALGSAPAYYGIDGLADHAYTLTDIDDALSIHEAIVDATIDASPEDPVRVVVGGGGLSGIQTAGEIAAYRDENDAPIDVTLVEALDEVLPNGDDELRDAIEASLAEANVDVLTGDPIVEATADAVHFDEREPLPADVLVWTGGITGRSVVGEADIASEQDRAIAEADFQTSDERVFAVGDTARVETEDGPVPPTAQAAMQAGDVVADNVIRAARDESLEGWSYTDRGTLVSVGERALAANVLGLPTGVLSGPLARLLKKGVAANWIASVTSWPRALRAWSAL